VKARAPERVPTRPNRYVLPLEEASPMKKLMFVPLVAVALMAIAADTASAAYCGAARYSCCTTEAPAEHADCKQNCYTVMKKCREIQYEKQAYTCYKTVYENVCENKVLNCVKNVYETHYKDVCYTVCKPV
jgi:hypothetical protein